MNYDFNLEYYKAFYYAAKLGSYSKAADALFLTQPTISHTIHRLEETLGSVLFYRTSHGMVLTPEGELLYSHVEKAFNLLEAGKTKLARFASMETQDLFVGATETGLVHFLLPRLSEFQKNHPNISVHIKGCNSAELIKMLKEGSIDIAIGVTPIDDDPGLSVIYLQEFQDVFIAGSSFSQFADRTVEPEELVNQPLVFSGGASSSFANIHTWFTQQHLDLKPQYSVITTSFVLPFVQNNLAIGFVPDLFANQWADDGNLHILNLSSNPPKRQIFLATNDSMLLSMSSLAFMNLMKKE